MHETDSQRPMHCPFKKKQIISGTFAKGNAVIPFFFASVRKESQRFSCLCGHPLLVAATNCAVSLRLLLLLFLLVFVAGVLLGWDPEPRLTAGGVLAGEVVVNAAGHGRLAGAATLGEVACAGGKLGADGGVGLDPVGERVLAVLDDTMGVGLVVSYRTLQISEVNLLTPWKPRIRRRHCGSRRA